MIEKFLMVFVAVWCLAGSLIAGQNAAPSSHLVFDDNFEGDILINEVRVPKPGVAMYTYYETLGWRGGASGYAGIQVHPRGNNFIFSIWDHKEHAAPIKAVHRGPGTITQKFGGEGTGLKSWNFELGWEHNTWYTLVSRSWAVGGHTFYGFWAQSGKTKKWTHLVTMDVAVKKAFFKGGTDAFIEDWLETGKTVRTTNLRGGWKRKLNGDWHAFKSGRYSVNYWDLEPGKRSFNFKTNWNGGVSKDKTGSFYFMTAGGEGTKPSVANPSRHKIERKDTKPKYEAIELKSAKLSLAEQDKLVLTWETDSQTLPQFGYKITGHNNPSGQGESLFQLEVVEPHARRAALPIQDALGGSKVFVRIRCSDILGNESQILSLNLDD